MDKKQGLRLFDEVQSFHCLDPFAERMILDQSLVQVSGMYLPPPVAPQRFYRGCAKRKVSKPYFNIAVKLRITTLDRCVGVPIRPKDVNKSSKVVEPY